MFHRFVVGLPSRRAPSWSFWMSVWHKKFWSEMSSKFSGSKAAAADHCAWLLGFTSSSNSRMAASGIQGEGPQKQLTWGRKNGSTRGYRRYKFGNILVNGFLKQQTWLGRAYLVSFTKGLSTEESWHPRTSSDPELKMVIMKFPWNK